MILIIPMFMVGLFYSAYSTIIWPIILIVSDEKILGTSTGLVFYSKFYIYGLSNLEILIKLILFNIN
jgi:hypothetical protein